MSAQLEREADWEASILAWLHRQLFVKPPAPPASVRLTDQTAIVTGSNVGLGFECCMQLLKMDLQHLILAVRSEFRGNAAASHLRSEFPGAEIEVWILDMESYDSIVQFARRCESLPSFKIVILNAGLTRQNFERNPYTNHETMLQVNYLSTALLAILLAPILKAKRQGPHPGRLTVVGSDMSHWGRFPEPHADSMIQSLDDDKDFKPMGRYLLTKLMEQFFVTKLAKQVSPDAVVINIVNPGFCSGTSLNREWSRSWLTKLLTVTLARTTVDGARAYIDAAVIKGKESHGSYNSEGKIKPYPKIVYTTLGKEIEEKLWKETLNEFEFVGAASIIEGMKRG
ncbi:NAD(P)-binding protein [Zopfia rhizophila CBS 207.26]|uniref:NAD(P)-binding protein n=1 Tax=Zopfia rhizophila CBS 207.26 TaxID=1314779 RepID=A0A6A6DLL5_9PEZI|nr:NAD(P)-binding protein [Zopfia rhizophila CBS 207.26]